MNRQRKSGARERVSGGQRYLSTDGNETKERASERLSVFPLAPLRLIHADHRVRRADGHLISKIGEAEDRFGDYLCVDCANLPCSSGPNYSTKT